MMEKKKTAMAYLLFEHDSETMKLLRDEQGSMILRKGLIQTGFDCDPFTFNTECTELNRQMQKNLARKDVKAHQYKRSAQSAQQSYSEDTACEHCRGS